MTHEESEPTFDAQLESCLLHGPVDDAVELLHTSSESAYVLSAVGLDEAVRKFEGAEPEWAVTASVMMIERPEVLARCLYEFERRDLKRGIGMLAIIQEECTQDTKLYQRFCQMLPFLERLRENDEGGSDGGSGDREPRTPHDPNNSDAIALPRP